MSDALPLPPRPSLEQYKKLARDLQRACKSSGPGAVREWAARWIETLARLQVVESTPQTRNDIEREAGKIDRRWHAVKTAADRQARCLLADAQFFVAREHGFASWPKFAAHIESLTRRQSPVKNFEEAADAIANGDAAALRTLLAEHPGLARARSTRDHRSTLLHYVSANGIEDFRQRTPANIVEIAVMLLKAGADVNAESEAYGGGSTTLGLAATSIHPEKAGVQIALLETLLQHGAEIERPGIAGNQHYAIKGCLANGQGQAARFFADRVAEMTLEEAAGDGRLDVVTGFFDQRGALLNGATREQLESGFFYACGYGRTDVVRFLLEKGIDPATRNSAGQTGLHWATFGPHVEVMKLLLEHGAPADVQDDEFHGTPLGWALHAWAKTSDAWERERGYEAVALLIRAGAAPNPAWLEAPAAENLRSDPRMMAALRGASTTRPPA